MTALFISTQCFSLTVPDKPQSYVNDYAALLSAEARQKLEAALAGFEKETSNQVLVAVFPSLDGQVLEDFSIKLAEKWKLGTEKNDNGVILLIFRDDRAVRIEVGYGLEGSLPDATAMMIIQNEIIPSFKEGDFDGGVSRGVNAILQATKGEYQPSAAADAKMEKYGPWIFFLMFFYFLAPFVSYALIFALLVGTLGPAGGLAAVVLIAVLELLRRVFFSAYLGSTLSGRGPGFGGGYGGFGGGFGGGGFGGGGGGSFGGGGASGRW